MPKKSLELMQNMEKAKKLSQEQAAAAAGRARPDIKKNGKETDVPKIKPKIASATKSMSIKSLSLTAMMTSLIVICSWLTIPAAVPFTMQTFAVFCSLLLLGGKAGFMSVGLYIFMGCVGLPVFSGFQGGIGHIVGPIGGYIIGLLAAAVFYWMLEPLSSQKEKIRLAALAGGLFICYIFGTLWFLVIYGIRGQAYSAGTVVFICVLPYVIPDILKLILAWIISKKVRKSINLGSDFMVR